MQELRLVGISEDGAALLVADGDGGRYSLPISDELRSTIRRDRREPAATGGQARAENPLRPRDVQGLIRGGVPLEEIAERAGWTLEKVQRYEGPIRAERDYVSELAQRVQLFGRGESTTLRERADRRLAERGVEAERVVWDSWKNDDALWTVIVRFPAGGRQREATWLFDPVNRSLRTVDDEARWLGGDEIASADEEAPQRQKAVARKRAGGSARDAREAAVYDVEAEGGLAEAQAAHLGATVGASEDAPRDITASMRARQASRSRARSGGSKSRASAATHVPGMSTGSDAVPPAERLDVGQTPPPLPSHPRPSEVDAAAAATQEESSPRRADADAGPVSPDAEKAALVMVDTSAASHGEAADTPDDDTPDDDAPEASSDERGSRRRRARRPRARVESRSVRSALRSDDEENDESLLGELPGFHDDEPDDARDEWDDADERDDAPDDAAAGDSQGEAVEDDRDDVEDGDEPNDAPSEQDSAQTESAPPAQVPQRASHSRKSGRPSVPSWDDIMFGGRGPKK